MKVQCALCNAEIDAKFKIAIKDLPYWGFHYWGDKDDGSYHCTCQYCTFLLTMDTKNPAIPQQLTEQKANQKPEKEKKEPETFSNKFMQVSCSSCGKSEQFDGNAKIADIEKRGFEVWGVNDDDSYFCVCKTCMENDAPHDTYFSYSSDDKTLKASNNKVDTQKIILYREI